MSSNKCAPMLNKRNVASCQSGACLLETVIALFVLFIATLGTIDIGLSLHGKALLTFMSADYARIAGLDDATRALENSEVCDEISGELADNARSHITPFAYAMTDLTPSVTVSQSSSSGDWSVKIRVQASRLCFFCGIISGVNHHDITAEAPIENKRFYCT